MSKITKIIYNNPLIRGLSMDFKTELGSEDMVEKLFLENKNIFKDYDIYEFGTYLGQSLCGILKYLDDNGFEYNRFVGFDSLLGLPKELEDKNNNKFWTEGTFSIKEHTKQDMDVINYKDFLNKTNRLPNKHINKFHMYKGFFSDSLKDNIVDELKLPLFINIDCDIYTSTNQVLDFIFRNKLYIPNKTIIRYDDWANNNNEFETGQSKSHKEMVEKYNIDMELLLKHSYNKDPEATWWLIKN